MKALSILILAGLLAGCGDKPASTDAKDPTPPAAPAGPREPKAADSNAPAGAVADEQALLDHLTQTLRKFSAEKQRVPTQLNELVTAGYLPSLPAAPAGKQFTINPKRVEVILADK